jgi:hypothetical protein
LKLILAPNRFAFLSQKPANFKDSNLKNQWKEWNILFSHRLGGERLEKRIFFKAGVGLVFKPQGE